MKRLSIFCLAILFIALVFGLGGCKKQSNDNYYVRYEVYTESTHYGQSLELSVNTDSGVLNIETTVPGTGVRNVFSEQYGPLQKGFQTGLKVISNPGTYSWSWFTVSVKIYVSKNTEPFVLKAEKSGTNVCEASYVIDF